MTIEQIRKKVATSLQDHLANNAPGAHGLRFCTEACAACGCAMDYGLGWEGLAVGRLVKGHLVCHACEKRNPATLDARVFTERLRAVCSSCGGTDGHREGGGWLHTDGKLCFRAAFRPTVPADFFVIELKIGSTDGAVYIPSPVVEALKEGGA